MPLVVVAFLGRPYLAVRKQDAANKARAIELDAETRVKVAELALATAKYSSEESARSDTHAAALAAALAVEQTARARIDESTERLRLQQTELMTEILTAQKRTVANVRQSEKHIVAVGLSSSTALSEAVGEVLRGIIKLASGQVDQTTAIDLLKEAIQGLAEIVKDTAAETTALPPDIEIASGQ